MRVIIPLLLIALVFCGRAFAAICPYCGRNHLPDPPKVEPKEEPREETKEEPPKEKEKDEVLLSVSRERFQTSSLEIADACDKILDRLEARYGTPKVWKSFPVFFRRYTGNGIAGYTQYSSGGVVEVVVYENLESAIGGTLDHELTHAFFFYLLNSNFDLFLNEGLAQNSEYRRRESLRQTVYRRYNNGDFWDISRSTPVYPRTCACLPRAKPCGCWRRRLPSTSR